jgi:hypothetical protein
MYFIRYRGSGVAVHLGPPRLQRTKPWGEWPAVLYFALFEQIFKSLRDQSGHRRTRRPIGGVADSLDEVRRQTHRHPLSLEGSHK